MSSCSECRCSGSLSSERGLDPLRRAYSSASLLSDRPWWDRVHVVEEMVFGPRFPVVGSTLLSPFIRRRMRSCLCSRKKRKVIRTVRPGKTTTSVFLKNQRGVWSIFSSGSIGRGLKAGQKGLQGSGKERFRYGSKKSTNSFSHVLCDDSFSSLNPAGFSTSFTGAVYSDAAWSTAPLGLPDSTDTGH